jgi:ADP-ribose pyrophosphatase YjhB (NUDIX family)
MLPSVHVVAIDEAGEEGAAKREREERGQAMEEEMCAMVGFVARDLDGHLYTELLEGLKLR